MKEYLRITVLFPWLILLLATSACTPAVKHREITGAEFADLYLSRLDFSREMGKGQWITVREPFESAWDASIDVINDFSLPVMGIDQESKYILTKRKGTTYPLAVFFENTAGSDYTIIETVASRKPIGFRSKWESQLLKNIEKKLEDPAWQTKWLHDTPFYLKPDISIHSPGEDIPLKMVLPSGEEITIHPEDGGVSSLMIGYDLNSSLSGEFGIGFQSYGMNNCYYNCDSSVPGYRRGYFETYVIPFTLMYHYRNRTHEFEGHILAGVNYYLSPELTRSSDTINTTVQYENTFGYRVGIGGSTGRRWFLFTDFNYVFGVSYKFEEMVDNGVKSYTTYPEWQELDGNGYYFSLGIGYHF